MPYETTIDLSDIIASTRLVLINGSPLTGKTTSLLTFPGKRAVIVAPGEMGYTSVPPSDDTRLFYWKLRADQTINYLAVLSEFENLLKDIARGKLGEFQTVAIDGLHKLFALIMKSKGHNEDTDPKAFSGYHARFDDVLDLFFNIPCPYRVGTVYDGPEVVDPTAAKKESKIFPDLPGKQAKHVMGRFPLCLHSFTFGEGPGKKYMWHVQPNEGVKGAGVHLPKDIAAKMPATIEQDWTKLEAKIKDAAGVK